jgi:hypothetical protein
MLENQSLWQTATQCHQLLAAAEIPVRDRLYRSAIIRAR